MKKTILIASCSFDDFTTQPVIERLQARGFRVLAYESDKVAQCQDQFSIRIGNLVQPRIRHKDTMFDPGKVNAAWYRRPNRFISEQQDKPGYESIAEEYSDLQDYIWDLVPSRAWLNSPRAIKEARKKLRQLILAREVGFTVPETIVTNKWQEVISLPSDRLTLKMVNGRLSTADEVKVMYATVFDKEPKSLPLHTRPYPGIWQSYIEKAREWRITVVGSQIFDAAIYTDKGAKDDWRKSQYSSAVTFKAESFPSDLKRKCLLLLERLGLKYGAFDFIEKPDGEVIFLEVNPNGQYGWLEDRLDLPISDAVAAELAAIANRKAFE